MNEMQTAGSALFGSRRHTSVSRGLAEFRGLRPVFITAKDETVLVLPVEGLDRRRLAEFVALCGPVEPQLIITERRALALGLDASSPMALQLPAGADANTILALVTAATNDRKPSAKPASPAATAAIHLVKISQSLPAVLAANLAGQTIACEESIVRVEADAVADFAHHATRSLTIASEASVPLNSGTPTRFIVFQDAVGDSQAAIIVGKPDFTNPVPVRLHSACLTGDVFGSRRCDCGDQLRLALGRIEELGGGVILYDAIVQVERLEAALLAMGTANDRAFEKKAKRILKNLGKPETFEEGHRELGELLGFVAGNEESDAAPDPWWLGETKGIVFEDHANGSATSVFGAEKAKQAAMHPDWIKENVPGADELSTTAVLITPCVKAGIGAKPALKKVLYWSVDDFQKWAKKAVQTVRDLKAKLPPHSDLFWKDEAKDRLHKDGLTQTTIIERLEAAADVMEFVGK